MNKRTTETAVIVPVAEKERRANGRIKIARTILARPSDPKYREKEEVQTTLNSSRDGLYFRTNAGHYYVGMHVGVILGYEPNDPCKSTSFGEVVRVDRLKDGGFGIAVQIQLR